MSKIIRIEACEVCQTVLLSYAACERCQDDLIPALEERITDLERVINENCSVIAAAEREGLRARAKELEAEIAKLSNLAAKFIGTDPDLVSSACIEVAIAHGETLRADLKQAWAELARYKQALRDVCMSLSIIEDSGLYGVPVDDIEAHLLSYASADSDDDAGPESWEMLDSHGKVCDVAGSEEVAKLKVRYAAAKGIVRTYRRAKQEDVRPVSSDQATIVKLLIEEPKREKKGPSEEGPG